jgi:hypothetical protein
MRVRVRFVKRISARGTRWRSCLVGTFFIQSACRMAFNDTAHIVGGDLVKIN